MKLNMKRTLLVSLFFFCIGCGTTKEIWVHRLPNYSNEIIEISSEIETCQVCGAPVIPILYGLPSDEGYKKAKKGLFLLGGCMVDVIEVDEDGNEQFIENPQYGCALCGQRYHLNK